MGAAALGGIGSPKGTAFFIGLIMGYFTAIGFSFLTDMAFSGQGYCLRQLAHPARENQKT